MNTKKNSFYILFLLLICLILCYVIINKVLFEEQKAQKLYWFIPDGVRADPDIFNIFQWAEEGMLPNIKKMMEKGSYGYMIPVFPSHTPVNFATLLTGAYPKTHGVADGPMHIEGRPLDKVAVGGFRSVARKVPAIWTTLEEAGKKVLVLSTPGSTPPEIDEGIVIRGRWGGWGCDFHAVNFESQADGSQRKKQARSTRLFFFGHELTKYIPTKKAEGWKNVPKSFSPALEATLVAWNTSIFIYIYDNSNDNTTNYDRIIFSKTKDYVLANLKQGLWSRWHDIVLNWKEQEVASHVMFHVIKIEEDGFFRVRLLFNNINKYLTQPGNVAVNLTTHIGPMVDFVDNFPPQLIYYPEDKKTFLDELAFSFRWHKNAIPFLMNQYRPDIVIHDIYSPNQMLTSRWWLGYVDPFSKRYSDVNEKERAQLWKEVKDMYIYLDKMVGEILANTDKKTIVVLSSDHGASVLNYEVRVNNLLAKHGLLSFSINLETGEPVIDWEGSRAIYLKMDNIYIHPNGLAGNWTRASGPEYEELRDKVISILSNLKDKDGVNPFASITRWEDVEQFLDLPPDRVGDLVVANEAGYGWSEEMTEDLAIFSMPLKTGYKQAIHPGNKKCMWTPFIIMGPGVKRNHYIRTPHSLIDQYPTIMKLLGVPIPDFVDGKELKEVYKKSIMDKE